MSNWNDYFKRSGTIATCKSDGCTWKKDLGKKRDTNFMKSHLNRFHPELLKKREEEIQKKRQQDNLAMDRQCIKRAFNGEPVNEEKLKPQNSDTIISNQEQMFNNSIKVALQAKGII